MKKIDPNTGEEVKKDSRIYNSGEIMTQQSAKDECDINLIVESAKRGANIIPNVATPMYGDFTNLPDFRTALLMVNKAQDMFMALDARVRDRFANDPARLLDFLADDANRAEAQALGLLKPVEPISGVSGANEEKPKAGSK